MTAQTFLYSLINSISNIWIDHVLKGGAMSVILNKLEVKLLFLWINWKSKPFYDNNLFWICAYDPMFHWKLDINYLLNDTRTSRKANYLEYNTLF